MAHFARIENNIVTEVVVVDNSNLYDENGIEQEQKGVDFLQSMFGSDTTWLQCSYNGNRRGRYPGIGFTYDSVNDVFIAPKPFASWTLGPTFEWEAPVAEPRNVAEGEYTAWNEELLQWEIKSKSI